MLEVDGELKFPVEHCPECLNVSKVIDHRFSKSLNCYIRRRECVACGHRWNTRETIIDKEFMKLKKDGLITKKRLKRKYNIK